MSAEQITPKSSIALLDPLRAFCAISVVAWHLSDHLPFRLPVFSSAAFAVDIFMNISGFLMMYHYYLREATEPWGRWQTVIQFYIRRFFRIAPLYYVLLLVVYCWRREGDWHWFINRLAFTFGFLPDQAANCIMPDWSIALEMQFYAVFPGIALLVRRIGFGRFFFLSSAVAAVANQLISYYAGSTPGVLGNYPQPTLLPLKIHIFAVGMVAAGYIFKGRGILRSIWYLPGILLFATTCHFNYTKLLGLAYLSLYVILAGDKTSSRAGASVDSINRWLTSRKWLCAPAEFTYSAYLIHNILLALFLNRTLALLNTAGGTWSGYLVTLIVILLQVASVSAILLLAIERPGIRTGKMLIKKLQSACRLQCE